METWLFVGEKLLPRFVAGWSEHKDHFNFLNWDGEVVVEIQIIKFTFVRCGVKCKIVDLNL